MEFEKEYEIRICDINPGNHMGHDRFLPLMHDARCSFFRNLVESEPSLLNSDQLCLIETSLSGKDIGIVVSELNIKYKSEVFYPDNLKIKISVSEISSFSFKMNYLITKMNNHVIVAEAHTKLVSFDYTKHKPHKFSEAFLRAIYLYRTDQT